MASESCLSGDTFCGDLDEWQQSNVFPQLSGQVVGNTLPELSAGVLGVVSGGRKVHLSSWQKPFLNDEKQILMQVSANL
jgi:hypothetical protein